MIFYFNDLWIYAVRIITALAFIHHTPNKTTCNHKVIENEQYICGAVDRIVGFGRFYRRLKFHSTHVQLSSFPMTSYLRLL